MKNVIVPAYGTSYVPVKYHARVSDSIEAKISFMSTRGENTMDAAALVFHLTSTCTHKPNVEVINLEAYLYENSEKYIEIHNKFGQDADFYVTLVLPALHEAK